jgi:N-acetylglucosamine-6-phosphate deacetylase
LAVTESITILSGADLVLPDRVISPGTLTLEGGRIIDIASGTRPAASGGTGAERETHIDLTGHVIVPGFIDVHVHGLEGHDTLTGDDGIDAMARRLPRYGVTGFCPTSIACGPLALTQMLESLRHARQEPVRGAARVLPAHLESNFINPEYRGAQPIECIRRPPPAPGSAAGVANGVADAARIASEAGDGCNGETFTAADLLDVIDRYRAEVGIVTLAPEMPNAIDLTRRLVAAGHRVSLGHSGASYDQAMAGIAAGARHATHLFNRMTPFTHREPGLSGAVLQSEELAAEIICDGHHVHPAAMKLAINLKRAPRMMAITDGTAGSGLPVGARVTIGHRPITVTPTAAYLDDGTLAGSVLTMDGAFRLLVNVLGCSLIEAAILCATTAARELNLANRGAITKGATADLVVLNPNLQVVQTYINGDLAYPL